MAMKEHAIHSLRADPLNTLYAIRGPAAPQASDTKPTQLLRRSRTQNISLCFLISISAVILKIMLKLTSISPRDLGESLRIRIRSAFIYHTFHQSVFYSAYFIPSPQSVVRSPYFILAAINSFIHITYYTTTR